jgi:hypothetical protein
MKPKSGSPGTVRGVGLTAGVRAGKRHLERPEPGKMLEAKYARLRGEARNVVSESLAALEQRLALL